MMRIGINGFGRMGRLALRAGFWRDDISFVAINEPYADAATMAHLTQYDSTQGTWQHECVSNDENSIQVDDQVMQYTQFDSPADIPWKDLGVDLVLECTGKFRKSDLIQPHLNNVAKNVIVSAPVKDGPPNIVVGVNDSVYDLAKEPIVTAASCTTNCLAPIVRVIHNELGIEHGLVTTLHDPTNTQSVHDQAHKDPRRARASMLSLIPTSTNSATAVTLIIPELEGKLDSIAVRTPVLNASLTDCVFQVQRDTTVTEVNQILLEATQYGPLRGILGYETKPLVSIDYAGNKFSSIVDANLTRVTNKRLVKVMAWYDNEWGYANRMIDLAILIKEANNPTSY